MIAKTDLLLGNESIIVIKIGYLEEHEYLKILSISEKKKIKLKNNYF